MKKLCALILAAMLMLCQAAMCEPVEDYFGLIDQIENGSYEGIIAELCELSPEFAEEYAARETEAALIEKYRKLIDAMEQNDFAAASALVEERAASAAEGIVCIEITGENWQDYFEAVILEEYKFDGFGNPEWFAVDGYVYLKSEYVPLVARDPAGEIRFNVHYVAEYIEADADFENRTYQILWRDTAVDYTQEAKLFCRTDSNGETVYRAAFTQYGGSSTDENGHETYGTHNYLEYEVLDAVGTLWLYSE